jgi:beta-glucosidase/6-phospho-beta-glucosidase/beta-galactosidase
VINRDNQSTLEWRFGLVKEIETSTEVPTALREINDQLKFIWQHEQGNRQALADEVNNFICTSLYGAIRKINKIDMNTKENKKSQHKSRRNNRSSRKRFSYSRYQEIFQECLKKLADVVINNDRTYLESTRQPLETAL